MLALLPDLFQGGVSRTAGKKVIFEPSSQTAEGLVLPEEMLEVGDLYTVID